MELGMESWERSKTGPSFLAEETIRLTELFGRKENCEDEFSLRDKSVPSIFSSHGLVYRIERGQSTFCIRGLPVSDITKFYNSLDSCDNQVAEKLKLNEPGSTIEKIKFFKTDTLELAEMIHDQLIDRRFLYNEEMICNISDPGFSWWLDDQKHEMKIYFRSFYVDRAEHLIKLGPMGDNVIACARFNQAISFLKKMFPVNSFYCNEKYMSIKAYNLLDDDLLAGFMRFKQVFLEGKEFFPFEDSVDQRTLNCYFKELSAIRRFWIEIEGSCRSSDGLIH